MRSRRTALVSVGMLLAVAACGGNDGAATDSSSAAPGSSSAAAGSSRDGYGRAKPTEGAATGSGTTAGEVMVSSTSLGMVLVGKDQLTLYMFDPDKQGASTCYDQCAKAWPPLTTTAAPAAGTGVDAALLGVVSREDGTQQVTYNKWPLYYWAKDAKAGDVTGQGVNGIWWVIDAQGQPVH